MILQNISKAIREQNYYAVALEFVIVIAGVVIGFQINAWAQGRKDAVLEQDFLERLHADIIELEERRAPLAVDVAERIELLQEALAILHTRPDIAELHHEVCAALTFSHILGQPPDQMPTLDVISSTGRPDLIGSAAVSEGITRFVLRRDQARSAVEAIVRNPFLLPNRHPDTIQRVLVLSADPDDEDGVTGEIRCDVEAMRSNPSFLNDLANNTGRVRAYSYGPLAEFDEELSHLHDLIDRELGTNHRRESP